MEKSFSLEEIKKIASHLIAEVNKKSLKTATIIALSGELGSGKTTLTQEIAKILGVKTKVISPTFVIMKSYKIKDKKYKNLIHIDAYRLNTSQELLKLDWTNISLNKDNLIIVEWPERVLECITGDNIWVSLAHKDHNRRTIKIKKNKVSN